jgi:hypothetical protein
MNRSGVILPDEVEEVILLGDGDSDPDTTYAQLAVAGRRFVAQGRKVSIHLSSAGKDFSDMLWQEAEAVA